MSEAANTLSAAGSTQQAGSYQELLSQAPYRLRRRVRWADCDAGGIVYTPNFLDYAIETVESWFEVTMGIHWSHIAPDLGIGHPFVHCELDFRKMLSCGDEFVMTLHVASVSRSSYVIVVSGDNREGARCFDVKMVAAFISTEARSAIAIPETFRRAIDAYRRDTVAAGDRASVDA